MSGIMNILRTRRRFTARGPALVLAVLLPLAVACSDDEPTGPASDSIVGRWQVTSFLVGDMELVEQGSSVEISFTAVGTYSVTLTGDVSDTCLASSCTETGAYRSTATRITMDPGTEDELVFNYSIQGSTMTFTGEIEGMALKMILRRL